MKIAREARQVSGAQVLIAGAIGPLGDVGDAEDERHELFAEQAQLLEARGVDLFFVETFYDLDELETAVAAVRGVSSLPVVALLTFDEDGETLAGVSAREAALRLRGLGVDAIGANHGAGPQACLTALEGMGSDGPPLAALPNLGLAGLAGGRIIFPHATPEYFSEFAAQAIELGARLVGGCCGTTPTEIAAIRSALDEGRRARVPFQAAERELAVAPPRSSTRPGSRATCARAAGSSPSSSTRHSAAATPGCSRSPQRSRTRAWPATWTSTTTRPPEPR